MSISRSALVGAETSRLKRKFPILYLFRRTGDYIDHCEKSVRAIERRTGSAHNLHPLDHVHIHQKLMPQHCLPENIVVTAMAVDQHKDPAVPVAQSPKAPHPDKGVIAIVGDIKAGHTAQDVG